eukprot:1942790-Pyramimonas_sp.AAC.1
MATTTYGDDGRLRQELGTFTVKKQVVLDTLHKAAKKPQLKSKFKGSAETSDWIATIQKRLS